MNNQFEDRDHAGKLLAEKLLPYQDDSPIILALPRGGVPIAHQIALKLHATLDIVIVKKIGSPGNEEFAIGAVAEDEKPILNEKLIAENNLNRNEIESIIVERISEVRRRAQMYRKNLPAQNLIDKTVIVVDDGLATGATMISAILWLRTQKIKKIIVAVPVSSKSAEEEVKKYADEVISLMSPKEMWAVGMWYKKFPQVSDDEVLHILHKQEIKTGTVTKDVWIEDKMSLLPGVLSVPPKSKGIILFAHGGGSSHKSPRNLFVAKALNEAGFATLLFDLLTVSEALNRKNVFDIDLMASRLLVASEWSKRNCPGLPLGYFGASTGAAAALQAAHESLDVFAIVSRGGRPDMAMDYLDKVYAPTLLLVGSADDAVIPLNELAQKKLKNCQLVLIPKAGHLFEEPGTLEQVVEYALNWFSNSIALHLGKNAPVREDIVAEIEDNSLPFTNAEDLSSWLSKISKHKIIMLGESTHGTKEFYSIRREISKKLIQDYGYSFVAVEGDWPDCNNLNQFIKGDTGRDAREAVLHQFHRWPTWMWANEEIPPLINWMRKSNKGQFYGLDVYSLFESLEEMKKHIEHLAPEAVSKMKDAYKCFESYNCDEIAYAQSLIKIPEGCLKEVTNNLRSLLRVRLQDSNLSLEQLFDAKQNARVIANAENYYRTMITGGAESWNVRDTHMMDTLDNLLTLHGPSAKAIVWAHNTHIGDYHATDMLDNGYVNLGGLARERYGVENVFLLGFGTYQGEVTAGSSWAGVEKKMDLPKAKKGSIDDYFHQAAINMKSSQFATFFDQIDIHSSLNRPLSQRAVGVVYDPAHESHVNYVPTVLAKRYDGFIFVDRTTALKSLPTTFASGEIPETWPQGQ